MQIKFISKLCPIVCAVLRAPTFFMNAQGRCKHASAKGGCAHLEGPVRTNSLLNGRQKINKMVNWAHLLLQMNYPSWAQDGLGMLGSGEDVLDEWEPWGNEKGSSRFSSWVLQEALLKFAFPTV